MIGRMPSIAAPTAEADHRILADRRIDHAPGKFLGQILGGLERAAERAHVLAVNEHPRIVGQRSRLRFANGFEVGDAHGEEKLKANGWSDA